VLLVVVHTTVFSVERIMLGTHYRDHGPLAAKHFYFIADVVPCSNKRLNIVKIFKRFFLV